MNLQNVPKLGFGLKINHLATLLYTTKNLVLCCNQFLTTVSANLYRRVSVNISDNVQPM
jgi:hypothetical protein